MRAIQVTTPGSLEAVELPVPEPGPNDVRIAVKACGICHSDMFTVNAAWPGIALPRVPGHEIAGTVDAVGSGVTHISRNARVGVGWHGGHDGTCGSCMRGDFITCDHLRVPGISYDGGYGRFVVVPANVVAPIPDELSFVDAAPLMCAGITTFNALRRSAARAGDVVAILGIGGLGHLAVRFAVAMGFTTIAIARGRDKERMARELGACDYIDSETEHVAVRLNAHGGAALVLATVTSGKAMTAAIGGLGVDGVLLAVGASMDAIETSSIALLGKRRSIAGWPSGVAADAEDTMAFCARTGIRATIETMPLERAKEAYDKMMAGQARFRMVLDMDAA